GGANGNSWGLFVQAFRSFMRLARRWGEGKTTRLGREARSEIDPASHGPRDRSLIGVLQLTTDRDATRDASHLHAERLDDPGDVHGGCLAFDGCIGGDDDFVDDGLATVVGLEAAHQFRDAQIVGAYALEGRQESVQNME